MSKTAPSKTMGMMMLEHTPIRLPGAIANPTTFEFPMAYKTVPGAWTKNVVGADMSILESYKATARALEAEGVAALTSNCGFTGRFQKAIAGAVGVPVATSSLSLVPFVRGLLPPGKKIGLLTYDAKALGEVHFNGAGWSTKDTPVVVAGIEGSESWSEMAKPDPKFTVAMLERDVGIAARKLIAQNPDIAILVLECSAFPVAAAAVRRETGLPVFDFSTLARLVMGAVLPRQARVKGQIAEAPGGGDWGTLGILRLMHGPVDVPGSCTDPTSYPYRPNFLQVPGAWTDNVTRGDTSVEGGYVSCAKDLVRQGCRAIVTTCGFTSIFQASVSAAVPVPVAMSSLLFVPFVERLLPAGSKIGLLTYDSTRLTDKQCRAAGFSLDEAPVIADGIQGTESWRQMAAPVPKLDMDMLCRDVIAAADRVRAKDPNVRAFVFECAAFPSASDAVRAHTGLPVFDMPLLSDAVMWSVAQVRAQARAAAE